MTREAPVTQAARLLTTALQRETRHAHAGALADLAEAASAKQAAYNTFMQACDGLEPDAIATAVGFDAMNDLLTAANENALVLEAVTTVLDGAATRLRGLVGAMADPGTYDLHDRPRRHVLAASVDSQA